MILDLTNRNIPFFCRLFGCHKFLHTTPLKYGTLPTWENTNTSTIIPSFGRNCNAFRRNILIFSFELLIPSFWSNNYNLNQCWSVLFVSFLPYTPVLLFRSLCQSNVTPPPDHQRARVTPWCWWDNSWFWIAACCCRLWFDSAARFQYSRACAGRWLPVLRWTETWRDLSLYAFRTASIDRPNLLGGRDTYKA